MHARCNPHTPQLASLGAASRQGTHGCSTSCRRPASRAGCGARGCSAQTRRASEAPRPRAGPPLPPRCSRAPTRWPPAPRPPARCCRRRWQARAPQSGGRPRLHMPARAQAAAQAEPQSLLRVLLAASSFSIFPVAKERVSHDTIYYAWASSRPPTEACSATACCRHACGNAVLGVRWAAVRAGAGALEQRVLQAHVVVANAQARAEVQRHQQLPEQVPRFALAEPLPVQTGRCSASALMKLMPGLCKRGVKQRLPAVPAALARAAHCAEMTLIRSPPAAYWVTIPRCLSVVKHFMYCVMFGCAPHLACSDMSLTT